MLAALSRDDPTEEPTIVVPRGVVSPTPRGVAPPAPQQRRRLGLWGAVVGGGALVLCGTAYLLLRNATAPPRADRQAINTATPGADAPPPPGAPGQVVSPQVGQSPVPLAPLPQAQVPSAPASTSPVGALAVPAPSVGMPTAAKSPALTPPAPTPPVAATPVAPPVLSPPGQVIETWSRPPNDAAQPSISPTKLNEPVPADVAPRAEPPRQEALVMPRATPEVPVQTYLSPLERGQRAAAALPCAALTVASAGDGVRVTGLAPAGQDLSRLLAMLRDAGRIADDITRIGRFACAPITALSAAVRRNWDNAKLDLAIRLDQGSMASGGRFAVGVVTTQRLVSLDLYQSDGSVRHLLRAAPSGSGTTSTEWSPTLPSGPRLVVAYGSNAAPDPGGRPEVEKAADYLPSLQSWLQSTATPVFADVATITLRAGEPAVSKLPAARPSSLRSDRCANIMSRAQLGETLSDVDLTALRTECRS